MKGLKIALFISLPLVTLIVAKVWWFPNFIVPTTGMEPGVKLNEIVWGMRTGNFGRGDIIFYEATDSVYGRQTMLHRLMAGPGDKLEIKDGIVYLNDTIGDKYWRRKYMYLVEADGMRVIERALGKETEHEPIYQTNDSTYWVILAPEEALSLAGNDMVKSIQRYISPREDNNMHIYNNSENNWSVDNFGPYTVPAGHYFMMGDNRHNSADSRFTGPVHEKDIKGVILR